MNAPLSTRPLPPYKHTPLFPLGKDTTTYRKLDLAGVPDSGVRVEKILGREMVVVSHGALARHAVEFAARLELGAADRVLLFTSFAFDVSLDELAPTLLSGGALLPWRPRGADPLELARVPPDPDSGSRGGL